MASWMTYARKIFTSVAGELEKTAQEFNDAIHSLSVPKASDATESEISNGYEAAQCSTIIYPQNPDTFDAGSIPEHMRGGNCTYPSTVISKKSSETQSSGKTCDSMSGVSVSTTAAKIQPIKSPDSQGSRPPLSQSKLQCDTRATKSSSLYSIATTATTCQPEPLGAHPFQSIHKRLSHSSPSLSPISHERDGVVSPDVLDSCIEDLDSLPYDITETGLLRFRTINQRLHNEEHIKPLPLSVSTPCLVHVQKILPSCIKKLNCPSSSFSSHSQQAYSYKYKARPNYFSCESNTDSSFELVENKVGRGNLQPSGTSVNSKQCSPSLGSKRPGKVVMVVSQPHSSQEIVSLPEEYHSVSLKTKENSASPQGLTSDVAEDRWNLGEADNKARRQGLKSDSGGQQVKPLFQAAKPSLKIERQIQQTHWRMLAPLARVLTFAYSQVVNAMFVLQNDESSISSGNNRSRASSFSKEMSSSHSSSPSKFFTSAITPQPVQSVDKSFHRRQMSQISLAGSALSSDSFEVLDVSEMESSNFVYISHDSSDILHEYHLFPSKPSLSNHCALSECSTSMSHSGAIFTTPFSANSISAAKYGLMSSSSADFAHFDFKELISNRRDNKLNPLIAGDVGKISVSNEVCDLQDESGSSINDDMLHSFVVLDKNSSPVMVYNSGSGGSIPNLSQKGAEFDQESQSSFSILSENEFELKA